MSRKKNKTIQWFHKHQRSSIVHLAVREANQGRRETRNVISRFMKNIIEMHCSTEQRKKVKLSMLHLIRSSDDALSEIDSEDISAKKRKQKRNVPY